jgi:alkanesulfonate monooxygenase SsuD/methylene tetrahydromethanopterin reductase-like flavin-dependent oxidoreductase (luciferase family)
VVGELINEAESNDVDLKAKSLTLTTKTNTAVSTMELGIYTFGDITPDPSSGRTISTAQRYAEILAAAKLADETGLHVFGVGEHHRLDLPISSPAVIMAAIAGGTKRIRVSSAVTILSTLDPVRVFQDFATVDLLSGGRAELIAGRGAYIESFSLFGDDFANYDALFAEKLDLLLRLSESERITWNGRFRSSLNNSQISPRPVGKLPIWLGVGGNPESALRAGELGLPVILANISQPPTNFVTQIAAYRQRHAERGHDASTLKVAIATHTHVAKDSQRALDEFYPYYSAYFREHAPRANGEVPRDVYQKRAEPGGAIFVGSPQQIIDKLMYERELFAHDRFLGQVDIGGLPYAKVARSIELLATHVLPAIRGSGVNQVC